MSILLLTLVIGCLAVTGRSEHACKNWSNHRNFGRVHREGICGRDKLNREISSRILNGKTAVAGSLPWMARVSSQKGTCTRFCGGSVINDIFVLTAAHCLPTGNPTVKVTLGLHNRMALGDALAEDYDVVKYIVHPKYDPISSKNDIALLRLSRSIDFESPYINYICLPTSCDLARRAFQGVNFTMAGWGFVSSDSEATDLQRVELPQGSCPFFRRNGTRYTPFQSQLCTRSVDFSVCYGDSGGPLLYKTADRVVQVGVLAMGAANCTSNSKVKTSYFTRVASLMSWILDNIDP